MSRMVLSMPETQRFYSQPVKPGRQPIGLPSLATTITPVAPQGSCAGARIRVLTHGRRVIITHAAAGTLEPQPGQSHVCVFAGTAMPTARTFDVTWETHFVRAAEVNITCEPPKVETISESWLVSARRQINDFERMGEGWDDEGALAFGHATVRSARAVARTISLFLQVSQIRTVPSIVPLRDGSIRFEWVNGDRELFLTVLDRHVEAQRWRPLGTVQSLSYVQMRPEEISAELEWLAG